MGFHTPEDEGYRRARALRTGEETLDPVHLRFVERFERRFGFAPLAIEPGVTELSGGRGWPRLDLALERSEQLRALGAPEQREIAEMFVDAHIGTSLRRLFGMPRTTPFSYPWREEIFVSLSDFEQCAKWELNGLVTDEERAGWIDSLGLGEAFWTTERYVGPPVVFVQTDAQLAEVSDPERLSAWADGWFDLAASHDDFGYLTRGEVVIEIDSRERFEREFHGSWWAYFK